MTCGIYKLTILRGDSKPIFYVGQSVNVERRIGDHLKTLRSRTHYNRRIQGAYDKYGRAAVCSEIVLVCAPDRLTIYEQAIFDFYVGEVGHRSMLNIQRECVESGFGLKRSKEVRAKLSAAKKGRPGRRWTPEQIEKIRATKKAQGTRPSAECIALSVAARRGKNHSPETKAKMSATRKGRALSPEHRAAIAQASLKREADRREDRLSRR